MFRFKQNRRLRHCRHIFLMSAFAICVAFPLPGAEPVILERVPNGGLQPQIARQANGTVHLLYFTGEPSAGDLWYCRRGVSDSAFSDAIRINSEPGSAIAVGTIRGGQIALGRNGRVHVAWNGAKQAVPRGPLGETPLLYTRLDDSGTRFESQRNLITREFGLDGGACIAADGNGMVYVAWHAGDGDETTRRIWIVRSEDDGETFMPECAIDSERAGACGCCGMCGAVDGDGRVMFLYRAARGGVDRDLYLLVSNDNGKTFNSRMLQKWKVNTCPMSSGAFSHSGNHSWAAWETDGQVYFTAIESDRKDFLKPAPATGAGANRKHPRLAVNNQGQLLFLWTEGTGWNRGGSFAWQVLSPQGLPIDGSGRSPGIPTWSFAAAYARSDGTFVILY